MNDTEPEFFEINYPFGTLIVDPDIYYRIAKDKSKVPRPYHKFKSIRGISFYTKLVSCRIGSDKKYTLARLLMQPARDKVVDHINRNRFDNRKSNLRVVNPRQNSLNRTPNSSTGYIGVSLTNNRGKMRLRATFQTVGARLNFSMNDDKPENRIICALVHDKFVIEAGDDEYAPLNFPCWQFEPFRSILLTEDLRRWAEKNS
ncbi:MAG: hypothetical protein A2173_00535 [Planctomycetes bacterium RBG_13_44_8b]|nr:MAG: hypothetical protein A2173_00535 [Planctomycetes bacterium RBG_13_44_8b]